MTAPRTCRGARASARRRQRRHNRFAYAGALATGAVLVLMAAHDRGLARLPAQSGPSVPRQIKTRPATQLPQPSTASSTQPTAPATTAAINPGSPWTVLALGDSVPAGTACGCTPFPTLYAADVAVLSGRSTTSLNLAEPGLTSAGLLAQVAPGTVAADQLGQAPVLTVTIGANDFGYQPSAQCPQLACYAGQLAALRDNVAGLLKRIAVARSGKPTAVLVLGYWEVWEDGQVGAGRGTDYMKVNNALTAAVNRTLAVAARGTATYVDLQATFHPSPGEPDTDLLAADGNHPNAAGHVAIAQALRSLGLPISLRPPVA